MLLEQGWAEPSDFFNNVIDVFESRIKIHIFEFFYLF